MAEIALSTKQQGDGNGSDGTTRTAAGTRMGELYTAHPASLYDRWLRGGKVFEAHFATEGGSATVEANATLDLTEPFFRFTVPSSKVCVPIKVKVTPTVVWVTADGVIIYTSDTDTYTTGGAAPDVRNMASVNSSDSALGTSAVTSIFDGDSVLTEAALTNPRVIDITWFRTGGLFIPYEYNILKGDPMVMIHGTSSFCVAAQATGALEVHYSIIWAELDKSELVNS